MNVSVSRAVRLELVEMVNCRVYIFYHTFYKSCFCFPITPQITCTDGWDCPFWCPRSALSWKPLSWKQRGVSRVEAEQGVNRAEAVCLHAGSEWGVSRAEAVGLRVGSEQGGGGVSAFGE